MELWWDPVSAGEICPGCPIALGCPPASLQHPPEPTLVIAVFPVTGGITSAMPHPHFADLLLASENPWGPSLDPNPPPHAVPSPWPYQRSPAPPWQGGKRGAVGPAPHQREAACRGVRGLGSAPPAAAGSLRHGAEPGEGTRWVEPAARGAGNPHQAKPRCCLSWGSSGWKWLKDARNERWWLEETPGLLLGHKVMLRAARVRASITLSAL